MIEKSDIQNKEVNLFFSKRGPLCLIFYFGILGGRVVHLNHRSRMAITLELLWRHFYILKIHSSNMASI